MIPQAFVTAWRQHAPWPSDEQVEQDLVISRALVEMYSAPAIQQSLAFRGGTAISKLYLKPALRYSEDIDLVQLRPEPIGPTLRVLRSVLDPWLGEPSWKQVHASVKLIYRLGLGRDSSAQRKLKIEINTREHEPVFGLLAKNFSVDSRWFSKSADVTTYELDELLATKLRALYQRKKGRDLFDLALMNRHVAVDAARVVAGFEKYLGREGLKVTRLELESNLEAKLEDRDFLQDVRPLLAEGVEYDPVDAAKEVREIFIARLA